MYVVNFYCIYKCLLLTYLFLQIQWICSRGLIYAQDYGSTLFWGCPAYWSRTQVLRALNIDRFRFKNSIFLSGNKWKSNYKTNKRRENLKVKNKYSKEFQLGNYVQSIMVKHCVHTKNYFNGDLNTECQNTRFIRILLSDHCSTSKPPRLDNTKW